ncbi:hypothetical protein CYMTET_7479 [Cymbomonas tetramitiformis]|uniref:PiggyBac transposable element-derived protein domain-containing protein n=1 Tax=Cymbomonas tetramitiformis TaxID=36881 RepID=A0AAE0GVF1_9CHLO|nr:hypothetical protein CYMTET_7479 [Cymbomonas tetramitiformis]
MPRSTQVTAREFFAQALLNAPVRVPAGSFNAEWNKATVRKQHNIPDVFCGKVTAYIRGSGGPASDRWKVLYDDGDETEPADTNPELPHVSLQFLRSYHALDNFPEFPGRVASSTAVQSSTEDPIDSDTGDMDSDDESEDEFDEGAPEDDETELVVDGATDEDECLSTPTFNHTFKWSKEHAEVTLDQRVKDGVGTETWNPKLRWDNSDLDDSVMKTGYLKYFLLFFPVLLLPIWATMLQRKGFARYGDSFITGKRRMSVGLLLVWFGIWVFMLLNPGLQRHEYWNATPDKLKLLPNHDLTEVTSLSRHDFDRILSVFSLPTYSDDFEFTSAHSGSNCGPPEGTASPDPLCAVRRFFDACNERWASVFIPGTFLCLDESMFKWLGRFRMPGWMKVGRKPDSIGHELKTLACGICKILFRFELQEGKVPDNLKKYVSNFGATTALVLRMLEGLKGLSYILIADSWFGSTKTCILLLTWGIYSVLNVKTAYRLFPKQRLMEALKPKGKGEHVSFQAEVKMSASRSKTIFGVGHKGPGKMSKKHQKSTGWGPDAVGVPLLLVSSVGTTLPGDDRAYRSHIPDEECPGMMKIVKKSCTQPVVVAIWRLIFHIIDGHNRQRTGTVAMHDVWRTQSWEHRDFGELLMVILVNAENAWKYFDTVGKEFMCLFRADKKVNPRRQFLHNLCYELITNPMLNESDRDNNTFVLGEDADIREDSGGTTTTRGSGNFAGCELRARSKEHVPVTTVGQVSIESHTVASLLQAHCIPQPLPQGAQGKCGVPSCATLLTSKTGEQYYRAFKTSVKCGRCHLKVVDGVELPAFVCSPLSGRTCWFEHIAYCNEHGHAHTVFVKKSRVPRKTEHYKDLSEVQRDIASGASLVQVPGASVPATKRRVGRPAGSKSKKRARKTIVTEAIGEAATEVEAATIEAEAAAEVLLSLPAP